LFSPDWQTLYWGQLNWEQTEQAVGQLRWSPGGRYLAFVGALDGFSSDLYVFDLSTKEVRRLTDGPDQALIMDWSPDGAWIVHQSVAHFGTGAGISGDAVWAAALDGSEVRHLYDAYPRQIIETWMDLRRFVVIEEGQPYGEMNILRASIENGDPLVVYEGPLNYMVGADVKQGLAVFILPEISFREDLKQGVYTTSIQYPSTPQLILPGKWSRASCCWEQGMCFVVNKAGKLAGFEINGEVRFITNIPTAKYKIEASPREDIFALYSDQGAWLYDGEGELVSQIIDGGVEEFLWEPDGEYFYILTDDSQMLYVGNAYDGSLALVDTDVSNSHLRIVW
jgi:WD40 repeat protein